MGWTEIHSNASFEEVFQREFSNLESAELIKFKEVPTPANYWDHDGEPESEIFACFKSRTKGYKFAVVVLFHKIPDKRKILWKEMEESMGPYSKAKCPKEILDILSPIEELDYPGYAKEWRKRQ